MKKIIFLLLIITFGSFIFAQSDEALDDLYSTADARTLNAALVTLQIAGYLTDDQTVEDAKNFLNHADNSWGKSILKDGEYLTKGGFSLLVLKSFNIPTGLMYRILPIKRYALREMVFKEYILGNPYSSDIISSFDVIYALSSIDSNMTYYDSEDNTVEEVLISEEEVVTEDDVVTEEEIVTEEEVVTEDDVVTEEVVPAEEIVQ